MIDRDTAIQMAKDAGIWVDSHGHSIVSTTEALQALITRAQNDAYEEAAKRSDAFVYMSLNFETLSEEIRALKKEQPK